MSTLYYLRDNEIYFPDVTRALSSPNGLLAVGGKLATPLLNYAYFRGIFPWFNENEPILWWSPDPRAILDPAHLHISHSVRKNWRKNTYKITLNHDFWGVINNCSRERVDGTWISSSIKQAYLKLHHLNKAHSVEVWHNQQLVGGLYGIIQGQLFCGESMFSRVSHASKFALIAFIQHFSQYGGALLDCQIITPHTLALGATTITRDRYLTYLQQMRHIELDATCWQPQHLTLIL